MVALLLLVVASAGGALVRGGGARKDGGRGLVNVAAVVGREWPAFAAEYSERWFKPDAMVQDGEDVTGSEEVRRIDFRSERDWKTVVVGGRTYGGQHEDGGHVEVHALPGTTQQFRGGVHIESAPDVERDTYRAQSSMPNAWLQPRYREWRLSLERHVANAVVRAVRVSAGTCPGATCSGSVAWLNEHGVPVRYEEWEDGSLTFRATMSGFTLIDL